MQYVEQKPEDAVYAAFYTPGAIQSFDGRRLTLVVEHHERFEEFKLRAVIIGESHYVIVSHEERVVFIELLACVDPTTDAYGFKPDVVARMMGIPDHTRGKGCLVRGDAFTTALAIQDGSSDHSDQKADETDRIVRLEYAFPSREEGALAPKTVVTVRRLPEGAGIFGNDLVIKTSHDYDVNGVLVRLISLTALNLSAFGG